MSPEQPSLFDIPPTAPQPASSAPARAPSLDPSTPLEAAVDSWLDHLAKTDTSRHTLIAFRSDLNVLLEYLDPSTPLKSISTAALNQFLAWMKDERGKPCSDKTYGRRVTTLKALFRWVTPLAELRADPAEIIVQHNVRSPLPEILTEEEIERCLAAAERLRRDDDKPDIRPLILFTLLLQTGMKKVEVANLKLEHIDASNAAQPFLYVRYPDKKDWPKERKLNLTPEWIDLYREYRAAFNPKDVVFPWSVRTLEYSLGDAGRAAGLEKNVSFDMMRWTCAVRDYKSGMEEDALRRKLGLSPIQWRETGERIRKLADGENL